MKLLIFSTSNTPFLFLFYYFFEIWFWKLCDVSFNCRDASTKLNIEGSQKSQDLKKVSLSLLRWIQKLGQLILRMSYNSVVLLVCCERVLIAFVREFNLFWTNSLVLGRITSSVTVFLFPEVFVCQTPYVLLQLLLKYPLFHYVLLILSIIY